MRTGGVVVLALAALAACGGASRSVGPAASVQTTSEASTSALLASSTTSEVATSTSTTALTTTTTSTTTVLTTTTVDSGATYEALAMPLNCLRRALGGPLYLKDRPLLKQYSDALFAFAEALRTTPWTAEIKAAADALAESVDVDATNAEQAAGSTSIESLKAVMATATAPNPTEEAQVVKLRRLAGASHLPTEADLEAACS